MVNDRHLMYQHLVGRVREVVSRALPSDATVVVISKGDDKLLQLDARRAWHFPQREDGVWAGYHPADSAGAIAQLENLREEGAEFLIIPQPALWWLEHYKGFRIHLDSRYETIVREEDTCVIFGLGQTRTHGRAPSHDRARFPDRGFARRSEDRARTLPDSVDKSSLGDLRILFDVDYYSEQSGVRFSALEDAALHYMEKGARKGYNPHRLFDTAYYLQRYPDVLSAGSNPLLDFLSRSPFERRDPSPSFDTEFYYNQDPTLRDTHVNALVHYVRHGLDGQAHDPNPLFTNSYYLSTCNAVHTTGITPLEHYLRYGAASGRFGSHLHKAIFEQLLGSSKHSLIRGSWKTGTVLLCAYGSSLSPIPSIAKALASDYHLDCLLVSFKRHDDFSEYVKHSRAVFLDDFLLAGNVFRPSSFAMLVRTAAAMKPMFAVCEAHEMLEPLRAHAVPSLYLCPEVASQYPAHVLETAFRNADRAVFASASDFHAVAQTMGSYPTNVALRTSGIVAERPMNHRQHGTISGGSEAALLPNQEGESIAIERYVASLLELATRDFAIPARGPVKTIGSVGRTRRIIVPCSDWALSGVNSALEAIGKELIRLGWEVEIVFTRERDAVVASAGGEAHLPQIPWRYLDPSSPGVEGVWQSLIGYLESHAPCIMWMAYDFIGNGVAPALTDRVGVVSWVQSDDGDYYEQAYRLGRYCNSIVCVSNRLRKGLAELNPLIAERACVIHNASVRDHQIVQSKTAPSDRLKLLYMGRLVQYQKRVLDFIDLARALDAADVPYQLTLVGEFSKYEPTKQLFEREAHAHLADGRIRLPGRMSQSRIMEEFADQDIFLLLSDFEGLPLSLIEAMALGCVPVVADMESGIPEVIVDGQNGFIVRGRDYTAWAALLAGLWNNPGRLTALSPRARATVRDRFTLERVSHQFDELFRRTADEMCERSFARPPSLHWGATRSQTGDVLPPPMVYGSPGPFEAGAGHTPR